ncbi:hypothetical protein [Peribacillus muralis]|uniref:hypothetical protein n=1 Tax=Peribacillus muralis TaxID=264697 RepID=UPI003672B4C7
MIVIKMIGGEKHEVEMSLSDFFNDIQDEYEYISGFYRVFNDVFIRVENISSIYEIED